MCDCYSAQCEACDEMLPVHIGDFIVPRETVQVRCDKHRPPADESGWVAFHNCVDKDYDETFGTIYMRYVGGPELLAGQVARAIESDKKHGFPGDRTVEHYAVGVQICPNLCCDYVVEPLGGQDDRTE